MANTPTNNYAQRCLLEEMCAAGWVQNGGAAYVIPQQFSTAQEAERKLPAWTWIDILVDSQPVMVGASGKVVRGHRSGQPCYILCVS